MAASWSRVLPSASFFQSLRRSSYTYPASEGLLTSSTFNIINPRHHVVATDNVSEIVSAKDVSGLDDEKILALFTCGFFGGFVFAPERWVLGMGAGSLLPARYTGFQPSPQAVTIWKPTELPGTRLLPTGSSLFGSFKLLDKCIDEPSNHSSSYVDYGFGSDEASFAGCHRFRITRNLPPEPEGEETQPEPRVCITIEHFRCNPQKNALPIAEYIERFHFVYSKALFANGIQLVLAQGTS